MRCCRFLLTLVLPVTLVLPAPAGIIFGKHKNPAERVPQLIAIVKTDTDAGKRESAAKELREYDPKAFADIVPVLMDVLQHDVSVGVRVEAAQSLGKLRPVSQEAGWALEEATKDKALRVRLQARSSLLGYRIAGYRSEPKAGEQVVPPPGTVGTIAPRPVTVLAPRPGPVLISGETAPPPLAAPLANPLPTQPQPVLVPAGTASPSKAPAQSDAGPDIK